MHIMVLKHVSDIYGSAGGHTLNSEVKPSSMMSGADEMDQIQGLVIFNQEGQSYKNAQGKTALKYVIHHLSTLKPERRNLMLTKTLEYLWKHTHCSAVKINVHHYKVMKTKPGETKPTAVFESDADLRALLKERKFRWKNIVNG